MTCYPYWLKHYVAAASSPNWCYTSSSCLLPERNDLPASHRSYLVSHVPHSPSIIKLPCPPVAHLPASSKSAMDEDEADEYERWKSFSCNQTSALPMARSPAQCKSSAVYSLVLGMLFIPILFILFWIWCTNSVEVREFLKYEGVRYQPDSPY